VRFAELTRLLASDAKSQLRFLGPVPENAAVRDFVKTNSIYRMGWLYRVSFGVYDSSAGNERLEDWLARTELPRGSMDEFDRPFWKAARRLLTAVDMIFEIDRPFLFSAHGLRTAPEWELVRYLAAEACDLGRWSKDLTEESFEPLWTGLGAGVIDSARPDR